MEQRWEWILERGELQRGQMMTPHLPRSGQGRWRLYQEETAVRSAVLRAAAAAAAVTLSPPPASGLGVHLRDAGGGNLGGSLSPR